MTTIEQDPDFHTSLYVDADPDTVFQALTTASGVSGWWAPATGDGSTGGDLEFAFGEHTVRFRVLAADPPNQVRWQAVDCDILPDWVGTTISFDLTATRPGTALHFRHTGLTPQLSCYQQCSTDWGRYLHGSLVAYLQIGTGHPVGT